MSSKKLPIAIPPIIGLHYHAYPLSAVLSYDEFWPWFYGHYIQVYGYRDFSEFYGSPWFNFASFDIWFDGIPYISNNHLLDQKSVISNNINIIELVRNYIDRGWYTYAEIDDFYIPFRTNYQKCRTPHDIFIFGYDLDNNCFDTAGFNSNQEFSFEKLQFADFEKAYIENISSMCEVDFGGNNFIRFFKVLEGLKCDFDLKLVIELISDYFNSIDTMDKFRMYKTPCQGRAYGMETYNLFREYYQLLIDNKIEFDIRPIHLFWEHKNCMFLRIKYMYENNIINQLESVCKDYKRIENKAQVARNYMIRFELTNDRFELEKIINILCDIEKEERRVLTSVLDELQKKNDSTGSN